MYQKKYISRQDTVLSRVLCVSCCQRLGIHRPRTKYLDVEKANMVYVKQRKHKKSQQRRIIRRLINLQGKILKEIRRIFS